MRYNIAVINAEKTRKIACNIILYAKYLENCQKNVKILTLANYFH